MTDPRQNQKQRDEEVAFFDRFTAEHGDYDVLGEGAYHRLRGLLEETVKPRPGEKCIDLGCGTGAFTSRLRSLGLSLSGMDISPASITRARQTGDGVDYLIGDITDTRLPSATFDVILYSGVLHHFSTTEQRRAVLAEGFRLLAPEGRVFAYDPNIQSPTMWLYRDPHSPLFSPKGKTENEVLLHRDQLRAEMSSVGFQDVAIRGVSGISFRYVERAFASVLLPLYNNIYEQIIRLSPFENRLGTFLVSVAKKRAV